jgi:Nitrate reductase delta subunit
VSGPEAPLATGRTELLRALGAVVSTPPPDCGPVTAGLGLPAPTAAEHTGVFVLSAPPHAAIHLGEDGKLGGEGLDRVAGFWRVLGLSPPADPDHLGALLMLYAELGDAEIAARSGQAREWLGRARAALLWEHLWSWAPGYLTAVQRLGTPSLGSWARLTLGALAREARQCPAPATLPLALRAAPPALAAAVSDGSLLDLLLAPVRSGIVFTREDLRQAAGAAGAGYRLGERRYTLQAMLDQDPAATLGWLSGFARQWASWHIEQQPVTGPDPRRWWADRAAGTALALHAVQERLAGADRLTHDRWHCADKRFSPERQ